MINKVLPTEMIYMRICRKTLLDHVKNEKNDGCRCCYDSV